MANIAYKSEYYGVVGLGDSLYHHGIKGQKWGIRRYQNEDGSLTVEGKARYTGARQKAKWIKQRKKEILEENARQQKMFDNVKRIYQVDEKAKELLPLYRERKAADAEYVKFRDDFLAKAGTKEFEKYVKRGMKNRVTNDDDGAELKEIIWMEYQDSLKGRGPKMIHTAAFEYCAFPEYTMDKQSVYGPINDRWNRAQRAYIDAAKAKAAESYKVHGSKVITDWATGGGRKEGRHNDANTHISTLGYMMRESCEEQYKNNENPRLRDLLDEKDRK